MRAGCPRSQERRSYETHATHSALVIHHATRLPSRACAGEGAGEVLLRTDARASEAGRLLPALLGGGAGKAPDGNLPLGHGVSLPALSADGRRLEPPWAGP